MKIALVTDCSIGNKTVYLQTAMGIDVDELVRKNFERLLKKHAITAAQLARMINTTEAYLSDIRRKVRSMGPDIQARICEALNIKPIQFYFEDDTEIIRDSNEKQKIKLYRIEQRLGIEEQVQEQEEIWIERAKKKSPTSGSNAGRRTQRIRKKAG